MHRVDATHQQAGPGAVGAGGQENHSPEEKDGCIAHVNSMKMLMPIARMRGSVRMVRKNFPSQATITAVPSSSESFLAYRHTFLAHHAYASSPAE